MNKNQHLEYMQGKINEKQKLEENKQSQLSWEKVNKVIELETTFN